MKRWLIQIALEVDLKILSVRMTPSSHKATMVALSRFVGLALVWLECVYICRTAAADTESCHSNCTCVESASVGLTIKCKLSSPVTPRTFPAHTRNLDIQFLKASPPVDILQGSFANLGNVELLKLRGEVGVIHKGAFANITGGVTNTTAVTKLHLWTAKILQIESGAFQSIHKLETLEISASQIGFIEKDAFVDISDIGEVKLWHTNISHVSSCAFSGFHDIKSMTLKSVRLEHLSNGAFMGMKRLELFEVWNTKVTCMGRQGFVGMIKIDAVEFSSSSFPVLPLLSWKNPACEAPAGFHCMNVSQKINMSLMTDDSDKVCRENNQEDWDLEMDYSEWRKVLLL